ncbi:MAG: transglutaminase family protein [Halieaceae bacterium]|nr:transglutaminase family protein [Halieaceae bacterium]
MKYKVRHSTRYEYPEAVYRCSNLAYVLPRDTERQRCQQSGVQITPWPLHAMERQDYFGNRSYHFSIEQPHTVLEVTATSWVDLDPWRELPSLDFGDGLGVARERLRASRDSEDLLAREYVLDSPLVVANGALREYAMPSFDSRRTLLSAVQELTQRIYADFEYSPGFTDVATPLDAVLEHRRGVCQDFAHLAIGCVRAMGFPARYVSGYLETLPPPGSEKLIGSDESHAWFAVYSPGEGWFEFDPTNNKMAAEQHIITGWGRDYSDVAPLRGVLFGGGGSQKLSVSVDVERVGW